MMWGGAELLQILRNEIIKVAEEHGGDEEKERREFAKWQRYRNEIRISLVRVLLILTGTAAEGHPGDWAIA